MPSWRSPTSPPRADAHRRKRSRGSRPSSGRSERLIISARTRSSAPRGRRGVRRRRRRGIGTSQHCAPSRASVNAAAGSTVRSPTGSSAAASRPTGPRRSRTSSSSGSGAATTSPCARRRSGGCCIDRRSRTGSALTECRGRRPREQARPRSLQRRRHRMAAPPIRLRPAATQADRRPRPRAAVPRQPASRASPHARRRRPVPVHRPRAAVLPPRRRALLGRLGRADAAPATPLRDHPPRKRSACRC